MNKTGKLTVIFSLMSLLGMILGCSQLAKTPAWQKAQLIADHLDHPSAITTDGNFIYYVTGGTIASLNEGTSGVWKMPLAGGPPTQLFKGYQKDKNTVILPATFVLATDEKYVYWASGTICRTPKEGGATEEITAGGPTEMVLDDDKIYWHNFVGQGMSATPVYSCAKQGGPVTTLTGAANISAIAVDKEFLYWSQPDGVYRQPKSGGEKFKIYAAPGKEQITNMIADRDNFYLMQGDRSAALVKVAKQGGQATQLALNINNAYQFYADEENIYFVFSEGASDTSLNKISKNGGAVTKIDTGYIASYTVGKDKIYVTDIARILALPK